MKYQELIDIKNSSRSLRTLETEKKNRTLLTLNDLLLKYQNEILAANQQDLDLYKTSNKYTPAFADRLRLTPERLSSMRESLRQVAALPDPVGEVVEVRALTQGPELKKIRSPLGVIFMIFESRPNVITEAFSLAFKAGNGIILRGGRESLTTAKVLYELIARALNENAVAPAVFWGITDPDRSLSDWLMQQNKFIDVLIPRGGDALIEYVTEHSNIPLIKNDRGLCHLYVHRDADFKMALEILENAKTQRPGVCNAIETLLVDHEIANTFLRQAYARLAPHEVEWHVCANSLDILNSSPRVFLASPNTFKTEYLDLKISARIVKDLAQAIDHIEEFGSRHSECIVTQNTMAAREFETKVDAAVVYWNSSTRFTDGFQFGLGGEIGISTQKLHVRGPVGLEALTSLRWVCHGHGETRK